jgi:flavin reductase (DIM6/NTAB) family NADH-FMN oxidoreductase RutF
LLPEVLATLECRLVQTLLAGDHSILIGEVLHLAFRDGKPLAYFGGAYSRVG